MDDSNNNVEPFPSMFLPENGVIPLHGHPRWSEVPRRSRRTDGGISRTVDMNLPQSTLHRRQSRDNASEVDNEAISNPREERSNLFNLATDSLQGRPNRLERPETFSGWLQRLDKRLASTVLVLLLLTLYFASNNLSVLFLDHSPYDLDSASPDGTLGILLHPEDHSYRRPRQLTEYWNVTSEYRAPDGVLKKIYLINGQFPGPLIECRTGDRLTIHVTNQLEKAEEKISIHWHGLNMRGANAMDGASGFTQCSIPPNRTFTYDFQIDSDSVGTFWYHAHSDVLRGDGMYGGLVVHGAKDRSRDLERYRGEKEVLFLIGDWYHRSAPEVLDWYMSIRGFRNEPVPDSMLINGAGKFTCSRAVPARPVVCHEKWRGKTPGLFDDSLRGIPTRLRIVNVGQLAGFTLGVSSGSLTPLTVDGGQPIIGTPADSVGILHPGERVDILLQWDKSIKLADWRMRISFDQENFKYPNLALQSHQSFPFFTSRTIDTASLMHDWEMGLETPRTPFALDKARADVTPPHNYDKIPHTADHTILLYVKTEQRSQFGNHPMGFINRTSWAPQATPPLPLNTLPRESWDSHQFIPFIPIPKSKPLWVDIILNNLDDDSHPFHIHGYNFYVLSSHRADHGWGSYSPYAKVGDTAIKPNLNLVDPLRKDTFNVPRRGYAVLRFRADNPGIWMFHCHVLFHMASGMTMGLLVGGDDGHTNIDSEALDYCRSL